MIHDPFFQSTDRRGFLRTLALLGVAARTLIGSRSAGAASPTASAPEADPDTAAEWPVLPRRMLGSTGFEGSRLVFGCGAALSRRRRDDLLEAAFDAGINVFDVGTRRYYDDAEVNLAPFLKRTHRAGRVRDQIFLVSKAMVYLDVGPDERIDSKQAREAARTWTGLLEQSLGELEVDAVDAYYLMAAHNPWIVSSEEMGRAFEDARRSGKTRYIGLSTHQNQQRVLEAAMQTGWYRLAQIAVTPAGWYDWESRGIARETLTMAELRPFLERVRSSDIALIGMKAGRYLAGRKFLGWGKPAAFDEHYDEGYLASDLSPFQRSYAYVLAHGLDAVNADMQSLEHLRENATATAVSARHFA